MSERRWLIAVLAVVTVFVASAAAQDEKNEVAGIIGRTYISKQAIQGANFFDPNIRFGRGLTIEASYARRLLLKELYAVSGEVPVLFNPDEDLHAGGSSLVPKDYSALLVAPGVRGNIFPTTAVLQYGRGLDVRIKRRLFVRGEGRDYWAGEPDFPLAPTGKSRQHNYFVGGGVFWRF